MKMHRCRGNWTFILRHDGQRGGGPNDVTNDVRDTGGSGFSRACWCRFLLISRYETGHLSHEGLMTYIFQGHTEEALSKAMFQKRKVGVDKR